MQRNFFMQTITVFVTGFMYCFSHGIVYKEEAKKKLLFKKKL